MRNAAFIPIRARLRHPRLYSTNETPSRRVDSIGELPFNCQLLIANCSSPIVHSFRSGRACGTPGYILRMKRLPGVSILLENCHSIANCSLLIAIKYDLPDVHAGSFRVFYPMPLVLFLRWPVLFLQHRYRQSIWIY